jgi:hypothetical protein
VDTFNKTRRGGSPRFSRRSPTTTFDSLLKRAFLALYPQGSAQSHFVSTPGADGYHRGVKPDFVLPDGRWIDFKLRVSFREKQDVPWRPSALYSSLRKYIDHPANRHASLIIVYRHLHGTPEDVEFPIKRGAKILIRDAAEFRQRIILVDVMKLLPRLRKAQLDGIAQEIMRL